MGFMESTIHTEQKMKFSIKDFFSKCDPIRRFFKEILNGNKLRSLTSLMESFIFWVVHRKNFRQLLHFVPKSASAFFEKTLENNEAKWDMMKVENHHF